MKYKVSLPFNDILPHFNELFDWLKEDIGLSEVDWVCSAGDSYSKGIVSSIVYIFTFNRKEDAVHFKLRWK